MSEKGSYIPSPNMGAPQHHSAYPKDYVQPPDVQFGYPSSSASPQDPYMPNPDTDPIVKGFEFSTETIRRGFIRKVYSILSVQLLLTFGVVMMFVQHEGTKEFAVKNIWLAFVAIVVVFVSLITLSCCEGVRRTSPNNMIFLSIFTIGEAILVGYSTMKYEPDTVMLAVGVTAVIVVALTVFAFQTKWDFTMMGGVLFASLWLLILFSFILMFMPNKVAEMIFCSFGALLFSAYLIHDTQLIMGGNHRFQLSPEEYVLGAIALFLDIINLFLYILRILGAASKN